MASRLTSLPNRTLRWLQRSRSVEFEGLRIPSPSMRLGGAHFRDDAAFVASGREEARKLATRLGVDASSSVLDIGCGVGRLPIGMLAEWGSPRDYVGVDVNGVSIEWCARNLEARHPELHFVHLDIANERYNRGGRPIDESFRLPFEPERFDAIFLYSVFSHMESDDVRAYLGEFRRLLRPGGGVLLTAFVEERVPDSESNPRDDGPLKWSGPLHCVRFSRGFFERMVTEAGLAIVSFEHGTETDGQSAIGLRIAERAD